MTRSKANPNYQKRIDALAAMAKARDWGGIEAYEVKGKDVILGYWSAGIIGSPACLLAHPPSPARLFLRFCPHRLA
jgi:hypothetical protein